jgi:hypothetical protein
VLAFQWKPAQSKTGGPECRPPDMTRKGVIQQKIKAFIQNVHHFRDAGLNDDGPPPDRVVIFDEAQRACLHLSVSMRSFRAEHVSRFVKAVLDREVAEARDLLVKFQSALPHRHHQRPRPREGTEIRPTRMPRRLRALLPRRLVWRRAPEAARGRCARGGRQRQVGGTEVPSYTTATTRARASTWKTPRRSSRSRASSSTACA